ncbi:TIGR03862 family flavoprotein [Oceaniglobus trochenteri]|uniref:TIGR03862 family flavoprotein n=1 Tax=Oceaniglobus trochenteri TaxID=2763260 RepID=UPI001FDA0AB8|nr:TIGR03862 family flavoprotein [Oceaniglobus trochenteri]
MQGKDGQVKQALVIGGGPAGLMAAGELARAGLRVILTDRMPTLGRKFLMAGKSGLNLTKDEPADTLLANYGNTGPIAAPLRAFGAAEVQDWARGLGQEVFTGSTGRVFPVAMKASPLLRAWLAELRALGVEMRTSWHWSDWSDGAFLFDTPEGRREIRPDVTVLALGGASWARLGSDGAWREMLARQGVDTAAFAGSNAGLSVAWSPAMERVVGTPVKGVAVHAAGAVHRGEFVISARGLEGGGIYGLSPAVRAGLPLTLDLLPDWPAQKVQARLARPRGKTSLSNHLRKVLKLDPARLALLREFAHPLPDGADLARIVKALPLRHAGLRPLDEAISTVGGICAGALDAGLMLRARPGTFVAGEMIDWDAPTGGYLITACLATGRWAGRAAATFATGGEG